MIQLAFRIKLIFIILMVSIYSYAGPLCEDLFRNPKRIAIIGPTSGGSTLYLKAKGYNGDAYAILPTGKDDKGHRRQIDSSHYHGTFYYEGSFPELMTWLNKNKIDYVIPGNDGSVELAEKVNLMASDFRTSSWRLKAFKNKNSEIYKDKGEVTKVLDAGGVRVPIQRKFINGQYDLVLHWLQNSGLGIPTSANPLFIKPNSGAMSMGAYKVDSMEQLERAYQIIFNMKDPNGHDVKVDEVLVSEYLGDPKKMDQEYHVNLVGLMGESLISDMFNYVKRMNGSHEDEKRIYLYDDLIDMSKLSPNDEIKIKAIQQYALNVVKILGKENGASHIEIMWTSSGPMLVEFNGRLAGGNTVRLVDQVTGGLSQVDLLLESIFAPDRFLQRVRSGYTYDVRGYSASLVQPMIINPGRLDLNKIHQWLNSEALPALYLFGPYHKDGTLLDKVTTDLDSSVGEVVLIHKDKREMRRAKMKIKEAEEQKGFISEN